jgi:hypothetical protein
LKKKLTAILLSIILFFTPLSAISVSAMSAGMVVLTGTASFVLGATLPNIVSNLISAITAACKTIYTKYEVSTYQGYKKPTEAIRNLKNNFESEVFGQEKAKIEITELLSGFVSSKKVVEMLSVWQDITEQEKQQQSVL